MPWKETTMSDQRQYFVQDLLEHKLTMAAACRKYGISRSTGYKWLRRYQRQPHQPLKELSKRPKNSPAKTCPQLEALIGSVRQQYHWGALKIWQYLQNQPIPDLPTVRTVHNILKRQGHLTPTPKTSTPPQRFEREQPNQLWQCDFKGYWIIAGRRYYPLTILDDHSRFLLGLTLCEDVKMSSAWEVLWKVFGEVGLPEQVLCDNAFGSQFVHLEGLSWFESRLIRLGIKPIHGRPYHPQTQGKVERLHGTLEREVVPDLDCSDRVKCQGALDHWRVEVYNSVRPHQALGGAVPLSRWHPSSRARPERLPEPEQRAGSESRLVSSGGEISWRGYQIRVSWGISGERVGVVESEDYVEVYYGEHRVRRVAKKELTKTRLC
jgi:transposase InsO family protein